MRIAYPVVSWRSASSKRESPVSARPSLRCAMPVFMCSADSARVSRAITSRNIGSAASYRSRFSWTLARFESAIATR